MSDIDAKEKAKQLAYSMNELTDKERFEVLESLMWWLAMMAYTREKSEPR